MEANRELELEIGSDLGRCTQFILSNQHKATHPRTYSISANFLNMIYGYLSNTKGIKYSAVPNRNFRDAYEIFNSIPGSEVIKDTKNKIIKLLNYEGFPEYQG